MHCFDILSEHPKWQDYDVARHSASNNNGRKKQQEGGSDDGEEGSAYTRPTGQKAEKRKRGADSFLESLTKKMAMDDEEMAKAITTRAEVDRQRAEVDRAAKEWEFMLMDVSHITDPVVLEYVSIQRKEILDRLKNKQQ